MAPAADTANAPRRRFRPARLALRLLGALGTLVLVLLVAVVCFALFPPADLLRRAALPIAREALNHPNLHIGELVLRPLSHVEIRDLWLGPPKGYSKPLFSVRRIVVRHDLRQATSGLIEVKQVQVERPFVTVESQKGKLSWLAFLEGLPPSEPTPEEPETESGPSKMRIFVDRVAVIGFGADVDDGRQRARLDSLNLALWAMITPERNDAHVALEIAPPVAGKPSVSALQRPPGKPALGADLETVLRLGVRATQRPSLRPDLKPDIAAAVDLSLKVVSRKLQTPWPVPPIVLDAGLQARADTTRDQARLERLQVKLNNTELLRLAATLKGVFKPSHVDLLLSRLHLPLELFAPYINAVDPSVTVGGLVQVRQLKVASELSGSRLPRLSGDVLVQRLSAAVQRKGLDARVRDLNVKLALETRPGSGAPPTSAAVLGALPALTDEPEAAALGGTDAGPVPAVMVHGRISLAEARAPGATLRGLDLRLASAADLRGLDRLQAFASKLRLRIPTVTVRQPGLGLMRLGLRTDLRARGDWRDKQVSLDRLHVELPELLGLDLSARAKDLGRGGLGLKLALEPAPLGRLVSRLPPGVRRQLAGTQLGGTVKVGLEVKGHLPDDLLAGQAVTPARLLRLPLELDARVGLNRVSVRDRARQLSLAGLGGEITCKGRPADLRLGTDLRIAAVNKPDQQVQVKGLHLPIAVHFTPKQLQARLGLEANQLAKRDAGVVAGGLRVSLDATTALPPLHRLLAAGRRPPPIGRTRLTLLHGTESFRMASPASTVRTGPINNRLMLVYDPGKPRNTDVTLSTTVAWLTQREQRARLKGLSVGGKITAAVPVQRLAAGRPGQVGRVDGDLALKITSLRAAPPGNPVRLQGLTVRANLDHDPKRPDAVRVATQTLLDTVDHDGQQVRVRGLKLVQKTGVEGIKLALPQPVIKLARVANRLDLTVASVHKRGMHALRNNSLSVDAELTNELKDARLRQLSLRVPDNGVKVDLSGSAGELLPARPGKLPTFDVKLEAGLDNPVAQTYGKATFLAPGLRAAGKVGVKVHARHGGGGRLRLDTRLLATAFNLWSASGSIQREESGTSLTIVNRLRVRDLNMDVPISQSVTLQPHGGVEIPPPKTSIFAQSEAQTDALYRALRPYGGRRSALAIGGITLDQKITARDASGKLLSTVRRKNTIDRINLDLAIRDSSLLLNRLYLKLFAGDIAGSLRAQVMKLPRVGIPHTRLHLKTQVTGVNLAYLDPEAKKRTAETEVSALIDLKVEPCRRFVEGRIEITRLSMKMLDSLLAFLDPSRVNDSVQENRKLINSWYIKLANPRVKLVSIWIKHRSLNMDIEMDAIAPVGTILKRNLRKNRVRRLNLQPFLERYLPRCSGDSGGDDAAQEEESGE